MATVVGRGLPGTHWVLPNEGSLGRLLWQTLVLYVDCWYTASTYEAPARQQPRTIDGLRNWDSARFDMHVPGVQNATTRTLSRAVVQALGGTQHVTYICHDYYYKDLSHLPVEERAKTNFDHPDALETSLLVQQLGRHIFIFVLFWLLVQPILRTYMRQRSPLHV